MPTPLQSQYPNILAFLLNIFWIFIGGIIAFLHCPYSVRFNKIPLAMVIRVRYSRILDTIPGYKNWRGIAIGNIVILNSREQKGDEQHELVHIEQFTRYPGIFPILNIIETYKNGYKQNRFEIEAYNRAGNTYHP